MCVSAMPEQKVGGLAKDGFLSHSFQIDNFVHSCCRTMIIKGKIHHAESRLLQCTPQSCQHIPARHFHVSRVILPVCL